LVATFPKSLHERVFVVRTGLDVNLQREAENTVESMIRQYGNDYKARQAAAVVLDLDGAVRAMVGGRDYGQSQFNRATDALRQPGSSFKPYVYATALSNGFKPTSIVVDAPICLGNWCPQNYSHSFSGSMTLTQAITRSINVIPVRLSVMLGDGNPKVGRAKIIQTAQRMGIRSPLPDSSSLPIGAAEVTVLDHTAGYATFPNLGRAVAPHAILEVRSGNGEVVWRFDRDGKKPEQVLRPQVAMDMNFMMNKVVEEGTARRSILEGIKSAGKTGTTNAYRDAWYVGFTGNYVCGVWFGNDDYAPTNRMTGGSLPAMTWRQIMAYAHQGIEIKNIPGVPAGPTPAAPQVATATPNGGEPALRPTMLTKRSIDVLLRVERLMDNATRALADAPSTQQGAALAAPDTFASTASGARGN
jgi:penicillin-binding protein 1A